RYLGLLLLWNRTQRLTGFDSAAEIGRGLFEDSLLFLPLLPAGPLRVADIGAGAGVPGVPLLIVEPRLSVTVIESRRKRASFLKTVRRELELQDVMEVLEGRAEAVAAEACKAGAFDAALARSVAPVAELAPVIIGYLKQNGIALVSAPPADKALIDDL